MPKQKSIGTLADIAAPPSETPPERETDIEALSRRVATLETLINDVMQQLDQPFRGETQRGNGKPKPKDTPVKRQTPAPAKKTAQEKEQQAASTEATATAFEKLQALLATSDRLTEKDLQAAGISANRLKKVRASQAYKESGIQCQGAPGVPRVYWRDAPNE